MDFVGLSPDQVQSSQVESDVTDEESKFSHFMMAGVIVQLCYFLGIMFSIYYANLITAGVSSAVGGLGYPSVLSFVNGAYNISTGRFPSFINQSHNKIPKQAV